MRNYITGLLQKYRKTGNLLDTNILLLYFVGSFNPKIIPNFNRTKVFTIEDYYTLVSILKYTEKIVTTPNILTEVSNLSAQLSEHLHRSYFEKFADGITLLDEQYLPSVDISKMREFRQFGITDAGIVYLAKSKYLVITTDFPLSQYLQKVGTDVLNFNHLRIYNWR